MRDDLAKLGFTRKERETTPPPILAIRKDHRTTRLSPFQRLAQVADGVRKLLGFEPESVVLKKVEPAEVVKTTEKISPATKETPQVRPSIKPNVPPPRRSRGIGI